MKNYFISTAFIVSCFYLFGALCNADLNLGNWDEQSRGLTFGICGFVCVITWAMIGMINNPNEN